MPWQDPNDMTLPLVKADRREKQPVHCIGGRCSDTSWAFVSGTRRKASGTTGVYDVKFGKDLLPLWRHTLCTRTYKPKPHKVFQVRKVQK